MSASGRLIDRLAGGKISEMRFLGASGQLGYGMPAAAFEAGLLREPHMIGCDMGSIDIGPYYLGSGEMATAPASTRRDLRRVLLGAHRLGVPLIIGTAGSAGARPHLDRTCEIIRAIAREEGLRLRVAAIGADIPRNVLKDAILSGGVRSIDGMPDLTADEVDAASQIVGQMGMSSICKALEADVDVVVAGRACDTAIFASVAALGNMPTGLAVHMSKIIECASICCVPGGRDAILATLDRSGFVLESMAPHRRVTPTSVAAHSLYEQADPFTVYEPEGRLDLRDARYTALDDRRTRVEGARWEDADENFVKIEGSRPIGERAVLLCATSDPRFIAAHQQIFSDVAELVRELVCDDGGMPDYELHWRLYGQSGARLVGPPAATIPEEAFVMVTCLAPSAERASEVIRTVKQYLLHHGYPGRLSTGGNVAFPFTPPEVSVGPAYRFNVYHLMRAASLDALFPIDIIST